MAGSAAKKVGTRANSAKNRPPELHVELPKPDDVAAEAKSPYPKTVRVYSYQPKGGGDPILLAMDGFEVPDKLWHFDIAQLPLLNQTWRWMDRAKIPKAIQRQTQMLPDKEYFEMFDEWFEAMRILRGGTPKGAVTAGK
jgi:hypothetical protein